VQQSNLALSHVSEIKLGNAHSQLYPDATQKAINLTIYITLLVFAESGKAST
jgi:hypothetical protein